MSKINKKVDQLFGSVVVILTHRASQGRQVVEDNGVTHMAAICAICKSQFAKVFPYYDFTMDQIVSVHQLVSNAIILTGQHDENDENDGENHPQQDIDEAA